MFKSLKYILWTSERRKRIDLCLHKYQSIFHGVVLDIGGRNRGRFIKPKQQVTQWIFADINSEHHPDILLDVGSMPTIDTESIDVICACELFEHVERIDTGLNECTRVLKSDGTLVISVPFLHPIHADPHDFQRWTETKWKQELEKRNLQIKTFIILGRYFSILVDHFRSFILAMPKPLRLLLGCFMPILNLLVRLDDTQLVLSSERLRNYHAGYFIVATKSTS